MATFRTELNVPKATIEIKYSDQLFTMGSCFSEHMGARFESLKFPICRNPFGILYNPLSIATALERIFDGTPYQEKNLKMHQDQWHSFEHHGHFSGLTPKATLDQINQILGHAHQLWPKCTRLILTFGTARVYTFKETGQIVANCHKMPGQWFEHNLVSVGRITDRYKELLTKLKAYKPDLEVILTVSPIRHIRDGLIKSQRSKATLLLAIEELEQQFEFVHYFPAFELLLDDLRDYRFFKPDLIHPNSMAIDYIWEKAIQSYCSDNTQALVQEVERIIIASQHRPFHPKSAAHQSFVQKQLTAIDNMEAKSPFLDFSKEKDIFKKQLTFSGQTN